MRRREFLRVLGGSAAWPLTARAQQALPVIGFLSLYPASNATPLVAGFRKGLAETGYVEGRNLAIEYRWAEDHYDRLPGLAEELVQRRVAAIVASGGEASALAAKAATRTIPIVFSSNGDPVRLGLVASLNRPGGNLTGISLLTNAEMLGKRLDLLHTLLPKAQVVGLLLNSKSVNAEAERTGAETAAKSTGHQLVVESVSAESELDDAYSAFTRHRIEALVVQSDPLFFAMREQLIALAGRYAIPAIYGRRDYIAGGGLVSYGSDIMDGYRQQGAYAGRILKGDKPADLPVVQRTKFELILNLQTAKTLGIDVPDKLLALADEVIE